MLSKESQDEGGNLIYFAGSYTREYNNMLKQCMCVCVSE